MMSSLPREPFITALCPTFRRPALLANSVALWESQDYPPDRRRLIILDDGGTFDPQEGPSWELHRVFVRYASLPTKFNALAGLASRETDAFLVWEDDDIYLPGYVSAHANVLRHRELSKPGTVLSDYTGELKAEDAAGHFHSTLGFCRELFERVGGWPLSMRADFDLQFISVLERNARSIGDPFHPCTHHPPSEARPCDCRPRIEFVYGWQTGTPHGTTAMRSSEDETWYDRAEELFPPVYVGRLDPRLDGRARCAVDAATDPRHP
jgi:hypothetical protein